MSSIIRKKNVQLYRLVIVLLLVVSLITASSSAVSAGMLTNQEKLDKALENLNNYLAGKGREYIDLEETAALFGEVVGVKEAGGFMMYTMLVHSVDHPEKTTHDLSALIQVLKGNSSLNERLASPDFQAKYSSIRSVDELEKYINGRKAEKKGDLQTALEYYTACQNFYDSTKRILDITLLTPTPKPTATPKPTKKPAKTSKPTKTPKPTNTPMPTPILFHESLDQLASSFRSIFQDAEGWNKKTAPQKLSDIALLPDNWMKNQQLFQQVKCSFQRSGDKYILKLTKPAEFSLFEYCVDCQIYFKLKNGKFSDCYPLVKTGNNTYSSNSINPDSVTKQYAVQFTLIQPLGSWMECLSIEWSNYGNPFLIAYKLINPEQNEIEWCIWGDEFCLFLSKSNGQEISTFKDIRYYKNGKLKTVNK